MPHVDALYRTALRLTRNRDEASDLVQDTFLKAFRFFDSYRAGTNIRAWLFRILTNSYINKYRRESAGPATVSLEDNDEFPLYNALGHGRELTEVSAEDEVLSRFAEDDVKRAVEELPPQFRLPVLLADVEGFSYKEIAAMTRTKIGTVMSRISRGRKLLQRNLLKFGQEHGYLPRGDSHG